MPVNVPLVTVNVPGVIVELVPVVIVADVNDLTLVNEIADGAGLAVVIKVFSGDGKLGDVIIAVCGATPHV